MSSLEQSRADTIRRLYAAYIDMRPDVAATLLTDDFTFSSPRDDHIDRAAYFDRCWPAKPAFRTIDLEKLVVEDDMAIVCYRAEKLDGGAFRNVELMRFRDDKVSQVDVYFGRSL